DQKTLDGLAESVKNALRSFRRTVDVAGSQYKIEVLGPIPGRRKKTAHRVGLAFEIEYEYVGPAASPSKDEVAAVISLSSSTKTSATGPDEIVFSDLRGICLCCPSVTTFNTRDRYCRAKNCQGRYYPINEEDRELFVTIVPERDAD